MKVKVLFGAIFALGLFLIPLLALQYFEPEDTPPAAMQALVSTNLQNSEQQTIEKQVHSPDVDEENLSKALIFGRESAHGTASFKILDRTTGKIAVVPVRDYVRGAVASEMPAIFHPEALKAQAVAAHTYALYNYYQQQRSPDPALKGADFSADPSKREGYMSEKTAREFYGDDYAELYWDKICEAVDAVLPYIMEYDDEPIVAAYHAISAGQTEDAGNVWFASVPYLAPAYSEGCVLAPDYEVVTSFTVNEVKRLMLQKWPELDFSGEPESWFYILNSSDSGYITEVDVAGKTLHGKDIRAALGLRSHSLEIDYTSEVFTFTAHGHGHGVGLSQYGADFMARQGYTFDEILENYYNGIAIRQVSRELLK